MTWNIQAKTCIITGANSGIGKETSKELARLGAKVIMVCRDQERGNEAKQEIIEYSNNKDVKLYIADLASQKDIRNFVAEFSKDHEELHVLINNAGILKFKHHSNEDGIELTFMVNYLSQFLLSHLLLDKLRKSSPSRIINLTSSYHKQGNLKLKDINGEKKFKGFKAYANSKLAIIMLTYKLAEELEGSRVTVNCVHPGIINTNITRDTVSVAQNLAKVFLRNVKKGAEPIIHLASSPELEEISGEYFSKMKIKKSSKKSRNKKKMLKLWEMSKKLVNI